MKHISLFTGIGGIDLAAEWAGFETVLMVENNAYCQKVLRKHWPDVPILEDIFNVNKETIKEAMADAKSKRHTERCESATINPHSRRDGRHRKQRHATDQEGEHQTQTPITLITGGFPCQPFSVAGKQRGKEDDRYLWPEMLRVIEEVRPKWLVAENVAGLIRMGLDDCISDLENIGYTVEPYLIPACAVNAPHRRDRIFIVAHSESAGEDVADTKLITGRPGLCQREQEKQRSGRFSDGRKQGVATDTKGKGLEGADSTGDSRSGGCSAEYGQRGWQADWWSVEPELGRVATGIPHRVDRLRALGNAVVPQQIYPILKAIADIEL